MKNVNLINNITHLFNIQFFVFSLICTHQQQIVFEKSKITQNSKSPHIYQQQKMFNQWCTIQSDPGVFTELVQKIGAPTVQVEEIYSMEDDELINKIQPEIYGFIFLFKWEKNLDTRESLSIYDNDLFFARQIVNNACATQAIISVLLNAPIEIQGDLKDFYDFTKELPSEDKGLALSNSQAIRKLHNSFSRPEPFIFKQDKKKKTKAADVYHFVSYVPQKNRLYELDGLQPGPILIGEYQQPKEWIQLAKKQIQNRILKYSEKQIRFNLLVVCENLKLKTQKQIFKLKVERSQLTKKLKILGAEFNQAFIDEFPDAIELEGDRTLAELHNRLNEIIFQIQEKEMFCAQQDDLAAHRREENIRRKHNYVPLIIQMLKTLAKKDKLQELLTNATKKKTQG